VSAWPQVEAWIVESSRRVEVLPPERGAETLALLEITDRSTLGAVAAHSGGILVDRGWFRLLGGGSPQLPSLAEWAGLAGSRPLVEPVAGGLCVAADAVGGFFVLLAETERVHAFLPDTLEWQDIGLGYSQFVHWTLHGDVESFYGELRRSGWQEEIAVLAPGEALSIHERRGATRPLTELWALYPGGKLRELLGSRSAE
jgi:hypothetical protein